ncbi:capsid assembly scaffolding protein Gp46 family protein [Enterocloster bolteae]|uniref:capsid assembly scaffolding protein Gp46 family protein n=1 Tax=Enterocloster bolteae TaxID=208479 RepID=UPI0018A0A733|nr:DUF4355 domain-containing protein [Enterocloster bolteae]
MKLTKLKELLKSGAVTQEEYDEMSKTAEDDTKADPTDDSPEDEPPEDDPLEDDLETKIAKAVQSAVDRATNKLGNENKLLKDKLEKTRKEKMTAEELRQVELQEKEDELARQQAEIQMEKNRMHAIKALKKAGLDDGSEETLDLVEFVLGKDEPAIDLRVKALQKFAQRVAKNTTDDIYKANGRTPGKGNAGGGKDNPWIKESWNLTKQMELELNDPELAKTMKASAGI